jgi:cytochrome c7-like protein
LQPPERDMTRRPFKDAEHLFRLAALFIAGLLVFGIARAELVPPSFGTLGHYRANAIGEIRSRPVAYAGQAACAECHGDVVETKSEARHQAIACESCHGPLATHAADPGALTPKRPDPRPLCVHCHAANTGKPKRYPTVDIKDHAGEDSCVSCHKPHNPKPS